MPDISAQKRRAALLREFEGSGLPMAEFCRRRKIGYSTMSAWRKAGRREAAASFVEVETAAAAPSVHDCPGVARGKGLQGHAGAVLAELVLPGGAVLRVYQQSAGHDAEKGGVA